MIILGKERYINRELSWLEFNFRVLQESRDLSLPVLERFKYLSIFSSNLDEFFMVRVASLIDQIELGFLEPDPAGIEPPEQLKSISKRAHELVEAQYDVYRGPMLEALKNAGITIESYDSLSTPEKAEADGFFNDFVYPVLTPMAVDRSRPFPLISSQSLNLIVFLEYRKDQKDGLWIRKKSINPPTEPGDNGSEEESKLPDLAIVQVPQVLSRLVRLKSQHKKRDSFYILLEDLIRQHVHVLFKGRTVLEVGAFRVTRNADLSVADDDAEDLLIGIEKSLKGRKWGRVVRLEHEAAMSVRMRDHLKDAFCLKKYEVYAIDGPIDLTFGFWLASQDRHQNLNMKKICCIPRRELLECDSLFDKIKEGDILLHHPFDSFVHVEDFVTDASEDPDVLAIKMTLYRAGGRSRILAALANAAEKGKQVTVLVELRARFDEEKNIEWAKMLERAGCHVIYGFPRVKTHAKVTMVVRRESDQIRRYMHFGTGNYNDQTARLYTDLGILTADETFGEDASNFFNMLSGFSDLVDMKALIAAPFNMRETVALAIRREAQNAKKKKRAEIVIKLNALVDPGIISELYDASSAGVKIRLIIRGICSLRPGVPGFSENIEVMSIVGEYLEHSRVLWFYNGGAPQMFISSADMMQRNLDRRIELMVPVRDAAIQASLTALMDLYWQDTVKARMLLSSGMYTYRQSKERIYVQQLLSEQVQNAARVAMRAHKVPLVKLKKPSAKKATFK